MNGWSSKYIWVVADDAEQDPNIDEHVDDDMLFELRNAYEMM